MTVQALVYRPSEVAYDRNGDPIDADGNVVRPESPNDFLGTLDVVLSDMQAEPIEPRLTGSGGGSVDRAEAADVSGRVGAPRNAAILLRHGDRLVITDSEGYSLTYQVVGLRLFDYPNSLTGWNRKRYWMSVLATDG